MEANVHFITLDMGWGWVRKLRSSVHLIHPHVNGNRVKDKLVDYPDYSSTHKFVISQ